MAKALKFVGTGLAIAGLAIVTGGAAVGLGLTLATSAFGVSAGALIAAGTLLSSIGSAMQKPPSVPSSQSDRLTANVDLQAFRATVLGSTAMAADVRYVEWFGTDQERCGWIVAHASHAVHSIDEIWLNDELAWTAGGGTQGRFRNYFFVRRVVLEGTAANAFSFGSGRWNANSSRLTGCAYSHWEFQVTGNSKKAESPFSSGIPNRVTIVGKGAKLYDPRRDSTIPGGLGPMRADDQTTWRYVTDDGAVIGDNFALQILRVLLGWRINGKLAVGCGVPMRRIGLPSFAIAANQCDERVNRSTGGMEPRYHGAAVLSEGDDPRTVLDMLCAACAGRFRDAHGKLTLAIMHNDLPPAATDAGLNDDDVVGAFTWDPDPALERTPNIARGKFTDPNSLYQMIPYPDVRLPSLDGIDRIMPVDLGAVESPSHAQRIVKQLLQRRQYQRRFAAPFDIRAWKYNVGDIVPFTFAPLGFNRQLFRVVETDPGANPCRMILEFEHPAIYAWDADDRAAVQPAQPIIYDSANNPIIRAIDDAAGSADWEKITGEGKPQDNATIGAPPGTNVGDRPVSDLIDWLNEREVIEKQIEDLTDTFGSTESAAASADAARTYSETAAAARDQSQAARDASDLAATQALENAEQSAEYALSAEGFASTALVSASLATQRADEAGDFASTATAQAQLATTRAGEAGVFRDQAAVSESNAAGSASSAATSATVSAGAADAGAKSRGLTVNGLMDAGPYGWVPGNAAYGQAYQGPGFISAIGQNVSVTYEGRIEIEPGRKYALYARPSVHRVEQATYVGLRCLDSIGNYLGVVWAPLPYRDLIWVPAGTAFQVRQIYTGEYPATEPSNRHGFRFIAGTRSVEPLIILNNTAAADGISDIAGLWLDDVTDVEDAKTAASASSASASTAAAAADAAGERASAAETSRQQAQTSAGQADASRGAAAISETSAAGSASSAASSASVAANAVASGVAGGRSPGVNPTAWTWDYYTTFKPVAPNIGDNSQQPGTAFSIVNGSLEVDSVGVHIHPFVAVSCIPGHRRRITFRGSVVRDGAQPGAHYLYASCFDKNGNLLFDNVLFLGGREPATVAEGPFTIQAYYRPSDFSQAVAYVRPMYRAPGGTARIRIDQLYDEDIEDLSAASGYASAAATSASSASASSDAAGQSASSATQSANTANTANSNAQQAASAAQSSAAAANASEASTRTLTTQASRFAANAITSNPYFADPAGTGGVGDRTLPPGWAWEINENDAHAGKSSRTSIYGAANPFQVDRQGNNNYLRQNFTHTGGWCVLEASVYAEDGNWLGSGAHVNWVGGNTTIDFGREADLAGVVTGGAHHAIRNFSKLVFIPVQADMGGAIYPMAGWAGIAPSQGFLRTVWHKLLLRPATSQEVEARKALNDAASNAAAISSESATRANQYGALATRTDNVEARAGGLEASVSTTNQAVAGVQGNVSTLFARAGVTLDANGYVTGWEVNNNGRSGTMIIRSDRFAIVPPGGGRRTEYSEGHWRVYDENGVLRVRLGVWG